jgi:hypothetical protein
MINQGNFPLHGMGPTEFDYITTYDIFYSNGRKAAEIYLQSKFDQAVTETRNEFIKNINVAINAELQGNHSAAMEKLAFAMHTAQDFEAHLMNGVAGLMVAHSPAYAFLTDMMPASFLTLLDNVSLADNPNFNITRFNMAKDRTIQVFSIFSQFVNQKQIITQETAKIIFPNVAITLNK